MAESEPGAPAKLDYASPLREAKRLRRWGLPIFVGVCLGLLLFIAASIGSLTAGSGARRTANRVKSASNLRQISQAIQLYTTDYGPDYPDSLQTLLRTENISAATLVSPTSTDTPAVGPTTRAITDQLAQGGHISYFYLGRGLSGNTITPDTIVAYEIMSDKETGANVLFGDGHVDFIPRSRADQIIAESASGKFPVIMPWP